MATYKHLRSSTANKRPTTAIADGQLAINTNTASPGLFFKDSAGTGIVKVGPVHVGTTAPNSVPASGGSTGNYKGEQWLDTSVSPAQMKVWNGSAWVAIVADELPVSKLQDGAARQLLQTDAAGTGVEWTSNVDVPGTLDVTGATTLDSTLTVPLGSAAAPTVRFTGDTNTGIYSPGADQLALATNGTGRLFVDSNGRVGLGAAASPIDDFHIASSNPAILLEESDASANQKYWRTRVDNGAYVFEGLTDAFGSPSFWLRAFRATNSEQVDNIQFATSGTERLRITSTGQLSHIGSGSAASPAVGFNGSAPSNSLVIDSDGKVGVGTSAPETTLEIRKDTASTFYDTTIDTTIFLSGATGAGNGNFGGSIGFSRLDSTNRINAAIAIKQTTADTDQCGLSFFTHSSSSTGAALTESVSITHDGKVGIGTTSPSSLLHLSGSTPQMTFQPALDTQGGRISFINQAGTLKGRVDYAYSTDSLQFLTNGSERVRIDSSGRLLIGTSTDAGGALLQVNGNRVRIATAKTPASASDTGTTGEVCWDSSYIYVCTATNTWKRAALSTW